MKELISISSDNGKNSVSARELHEKLEVKAKFADWIKRMIEYGFEEDKDFTVLKNENGEKGRFATIEYFISLDMAKEICMIQRTPIGRKFRQYFIKCEQELMKHKDSYKAVRDKSKEIRTLFTDTLKEHGYEKQNEYIQTTSQMKRPFGITAKKNDMTKDELKMVTAAEFLAQAMIGDEFGFHEVNPVCVSASTTIREALEAQRAKQLGRTNLLAKY